MKRQTIAILTLVSFIVFSFSCYSIQPIESEMLTAPKADKIEIRRLDKTSGESIDFSASNPGRVRGNFVEGIGVLAKTVEFIEVASADLNTVSYPDKTFLFVRTRDGKSYYPVKKVVEKEDKSVLYVVKAVATRINSSFKVALSEVEKAWEKNPNTGVGFLAIIGCVLLVLVLRSALGAMRVPTH